MAGISYTVADDWTSGFIGNMTVPGGSEGLDGWTVEFDATFDISNIWNAEIVSHVGNHYVVKAAAWNGDVAAGGTVSFGFQATPGAGANGKAASGLTLNGEGGGTPEDPNENPGDDPGENPGEGPGEHPGSGEPGRVFQVSTTAADIVGFDPAKDKLDLGDVSVHNFIVVDTAEGVGFMNPWSGETCIIQGVSLSQLTIDSFTPIINDHLRQDLSGALAWEHGVTPEPHTVYARSHEVGQIDRVAFDPATDVVDFRYFGTREQVYMEDSPDGVVISNSGTGQALILLGVTTDELSAENFIFHFAQAREDRIPQQLGVAPVPDSQVLPQGVPIAGTNDWPHGDGGGAPPTGEVGTTTTIEWHYGTNTVIDFNPATDKLDFGWFKDYEFTVSEVNGSTVISITGNNQTYVLEGVKLYQLDSPNIIALDTSARTEWKGILDSNNPPAALPVLSLADGTVSEGDDGITYITFQVSLSASSATPVSVSYSTLNGTATAGQDYASTVGTVTFAPGETTKTIQVAVNGDTLVERDEQFSIHLSSPTGATIMDGSAVGTIANDDEDVAPGAPPAVSIADLSVEEGNGAHMHFMFMVTLDKASDVPVSVSYSTSNGTAVGGLDFAAGTGTITFAPGETSKMLHVDILADTVAEGDETFTVTLSNPQGVTIADGTATGTIIDDDAPAPVLPTLSVSDAQVSEGNSGTSFLTFTVTLSAPAAGPVSVQYGSANGTAAAGSDYAALAGTLTFAAGETTKTIQVAVNGDTAVEGNETLQLNLSNASGATIADGAATGTIVNDDVVLPALSVSDAQAAEGNDGTSFLTFTVTLSEAATGPVSVHYGSADGTATAGSDYTGVFGTLTFAAGETSKTIQVAVKGDTAVEGHETLQLNLSNASGATIADGSATGTITNDDHASGGNASPIVAAYYSEWSIYSRQTNVADIPADKLTHLIYAFAKIDDHGEMALFDQYAAIERPFRANESVNGQDDMGGQALMGNFNQLAELKALHPDLNIMIAIGGWTLSDQFSDVAATAEGRATFAASVVDFLKTYTMFDGVDFDWEYPGGGGLTDDFRPEDGVNYALLLQAVRQQLDGLEAETARDYQMSVAAPAGIDKIANFNAAGLSDFIDFFNVMAYDFHGSSWESTTGHLAPVYDTVGGNYDLESAIHAYLDAGIDPSQLVLGAPAYGRGWQGVQDGGDGGWDAPSTGTAPGSRPNEERGYYDYKDLLAKLEDPNSGWKLYYDDEAQAAYVFNPQQGIWSSIETPATIALKAEWAQELGLRGMMFWDTPGDTDDPAFSLINAAFKSWMEGKSLAEIAAEAHLDPDVVIGGNGVLDSIVDGDHNPPGPALLISDATVAEGNDGTSVLTFTVTLSHAADGPVSVNYGTSNGTATAGSDYAALSGTLTFAAGETTKIIQVTVNGDTAAEANETVRVTLSDAHGATIADGGAVGTIVNDDASVPPPATGASVDYDVNDNWGSGFVAAMTVEAGNAALNGWTVEFDASFTITNIWNAVIVSHVGNHYVVKNADWNGAVGANGEVAFGFQATPGAGGTTATGFLVNGAPSGGGEPEPVLPSLTVGDASVVEGHSGTTQLAFVVMLSAASASAVSVAYGTGNGTASGADFVARAGTITFAPGETTKTVYVTVNGDTVVENNETLTLSLSDAHGATIADGTATGTIVNDDAPPPPLPTLSVADVSFAEGDAANPGHGVFVITLSAPATGPVTVHYATADGTAHAGTDYDALSGTLTFAPGETTKTIEVHAIGDAAVEASKGFSLVLSQPAGATIADGTGAGTITNDDAASHLPTVSVSDTTVVEGNPATGAAADGWFSTSGNQIVDADGNTVQIAGVNWFGFESTNASAHGVWTRSYTDMMDQMKDLGFNTIRLPFATDTLHASSAAGIDYFQNPEFQGLTPLEIMDKIIDYAGEIGMKVILDHHRSNFGSGASDNGLWYDAAHPESQWISDWQMLAARYADDPTVIGADLHNEPYNGTWGGGGANDWAAAAERAGNAIGEVNPNWLIFVEGVGTYGGESYWWGGNLMGVRDRPIDLDVDNKLVYSAHDYGNSVYAQSWFQQPDFGQHLEQVFDDAWGFIYRENIAPVYIGEFGTKLQDPKDAVWLDALTSYMSGDFNNDGVSDIAAGDQGISWTYWSWNPNSMDTGGILADDWRTVHTEKLAYLEPIQFDFENDVPGGDGSAPDTHTYAAFEVSLSEASADPVTVHYHTLAGDADDSDFTSVSGTITFAPGETTKVIKVPVNPDTQDEADEHFSLVLTDAHGAVLGVAQGVATITDDDTAPTTPTDPGHPTDPGGPTDPGHGHTGDLDALLTLVDSWSGGFNASIAVHNDGAATHGWELHIDMPYQITDIWNAVIVSHDADGYVIRNADWNGTIGEDAQTSFGFVGTGNFNPSQVDILI